ncbi:MAG: hypothetical protein H6Q00_3549 [Holophagaceae bacterium]|nr:hypothetical protein [Holophagaceae bacterium]
MLIVEMHRIPKPSDGYDLFDCPGPLWDGLRKLAVSYGWKPAGTSPASYHGTEKVKAEELKLAELRANMPPNLKELIAEEREENRKNNKRYYNSEYWKYDQLDLYLPRDWGGVTRMVTAEDGAAWAEALGRALEHMEALDIDLPHEGPCVVNSTMHPELNGLMNGGLTREFIKAFCVYLRGGAFGFAWDD